MQKFWKSISVLLIACMLLTFVPAEALAVEWEGTEAEMLETDEGIGEEAADTDEAAVSDPSMEFEPTSIDDTEYQENIGFLTSTLDSTMGVHGFEGPYELPSNQEEMVDIIVQFRTPPAVAQRLYAEAGAHTRAGTLSDQLFEPDAMQAHERFAEQLAQIIMPANLAQGSIVGAHYTLFNGVYMNVPAGMVGIIAELPEVILVTPAPVYFPMMELEQMQKNDMQGIMSSIPDSQMLEPASDSNPNRSEPFYVGSYQTHWEFNLGAREMFDIYYIHNSMDLTGEGIRVGIIDTGVDYRHPIFRNSLVDAEAEGRESLWVMDDPDHPLHGRPVTLRGGNAMVEPQSGAYARRGLAQDGSTASPMEMGHLRNISGSGQSQVGQPTNHGTHVAGTVLGMAPDAIIYAFRSLTPAPDGLQPPNSVMASIEWAYALELDAINLSLGNRLNSPWQATSYALNLANLAGMVSISSAGNDALGGSPRQQGRGGWFSLGGGAGGSSLGITVASGVGGGRDVQGRVSAHVNNVPAPAMALVGNAPGFFFNQWNHFDQNVPFTWFGRLTLPDYAGADIPALAAQVSWNLLGGGDLSGRVMVWNRGGGELPTVRALAIELNAVALLVINNQADNFRISETQLNGTMPENVVPIFSVGMLDANNLFGFVPATGNEIDPDVPGTPRSTGILNFGGVVGFVSPPDTKSPFSSVGPMGPLGADAIMHIFPDITAPGSRIVSANAINHTSTFDGRPYELMSGTSMASPAIAGLVALMLQNISPNRENLDTRSSEVKARLMSTARPLADYGGEYSVLQVGAGVARPIEALRTPAFATTVHRVPHPQGSRWLGDGVGGFPNLPNSWQPMTMTSMSFGRLQLNEGEEFVSEPMRVTIRGADSWSFARHVPISPTHELLPIDQPDFWGPPLRHTTGVAVSHTDAGTNVFDFSLSHDGNYENRGFVQGHLVFTNGTSEIFIIYGAYFNIYSPEPGVTPGFTYTISESQATVTGFSGFIPHNLVIPETLSGYPVTAIGDSAFLNQTNIRSVVMPNSVLSIGANAFTGAMSLESIVIPDSVMSIGIAAFSGATSLRSVTLPNSLRIIPAQAFQNNISLTEITLPPTITRIEQSAFRNANSLESINLPNGLEFIGASAFRGAGALQSIAIPQSVTSVGVSAFEDARALHTARVYATGLIGADAFRYNSEMTSLYLADTVTSIGARLAYNNQRLTDVRLSESLTSIPLDAFRNNSSLTSITIPRLVTNIAENAFADNAALRDVFIPPGVININANSFSNSPSTVIHGRAGSFAQTFADQQGITFVAVNAPITSLAFRDAPMIESVRNRVFSLPLDITPSFQTDILTFSATGTAVTVNESTGLVNTRVFGTSVITVTNGEMSAEITINVREDNFPITFNPNGGTWGGEQGTQAQIRNVTRGLATDTYAQAFDEDDNLVNPNLSHPTRTDHTFGGWFSTSGQTGGIRFTSETPVQLTGSSQTLWARWIPYPIHSISVTPGDHIFDERTLPNYAAPAAATWTVRNTGNQPTGALTVTNSNTAAFTVNITSLTNIQVGTTTRTFTVRPNTGLAEGTHTATITVSGENDILESFEVSFAVNRAVTSPPGQPAASGTSTEDSIAVSAMLAPSGWITQYRIRTVPVGNWSEWQNSNTFTGLTANTNYQVQARFTAINEATHTHSEESSASENIRTAVPQQGSDSIRFYDGIGTVNEGRGGLIAEREMGSRAATVPPIPPTRDGWIFAGWRSEGSASVQGGTAIVAQWRELIILD